jgi:IPT/TIG domain
MTRSSGCLGRAHRTALSVSAMLIVTGTLVVALGAPSLALASSQQRHMGANLPYTSPLQSGDWGNAEEVPGSATLNVGGEAQVESVSCASAGNCAGGGFYRENSNGVDEAFVVSETDGTWSDAEEVPGSATLNAGGYAIALSVSCASAGNCAAGGAYTANSDGAFQAFVVNETDGTWGDAEEVPGTATLNVGEDAWVRSVSCPSAGDCSAGGFYQESGGVGEAFVVNETDGTWGDAEEVPGTATLNAGEGAEVEALSCAYAGDCSAGGYYENGSDALEAFVVNETDGTWGNAEEVPNTATLNAGGDASIASLSCPAGSTGNCAAGGSYKDSSNHEQAFVVSETDGTWGDAEEVPETATLNVAGYASTTSVSCMSAGNCSAGGSYASEYYEESFLSEGFVVNETDGTWGDAEEVPGIATLNEGGGSYVLSVSCASVGNCAAGGQYENFSSGGDQAFVVNETDGTWVNAEEVPGSATLNAGGDAEVESVSCASMGSCAAGGFYEDSSEDSQAFVVDSLSSTAPSVTTVSPSSGSTAGGNIVTLSGSNFTGTPTVDFGTMAGTDVVVASGGDSLTVKAPAESLGTVNITVTVGGVTSAVNAEDLYTYLEPSSVVVNPVSLPFGLEAAGSTSPPQTVTLTDTGADSVSVGEVEVVGTNEFTIDSSENACYDVTLSSGQSCTEGVEFSPATTASAGPVTQSLSFEVNDLTTGANLDQTVTLSGTVEKSEITKVFPVAATTDPVIVVAGSGFGTDFPASALNQPTETQYLEVTDTTQDWNAGYENPTTGSTDGCSVTVSSWTDTEIVFTANVGGAAGFLAGCGTIDAGDTLEVNVWDTSDPAEQASPTGTTTLVPSGSAPSVTAVSPAYGPDAGGTKVTITGTGFSGAEQVWFGPFAASDPTINPAGTEITVDAPAAASPEGVSVLITGSDGITSPANCLFIQTGCADAFFYLTPIGPTTSVSINQTFHTDVTATLKAPPDCIGQTNSTSDDDDCADDQSSVKVGGSVDVSLSGTVNATVAGTNPDGSMVDISWNGPVPSAIIMGAQLTVNEGTSLSMGFNGDLSGELDVPIPLPDNVPDIVSLDDEITVEGGVTVTGSLSLASGDSVSVSAADYNGQSYPPTTSTVCDGELVTTAAQWQSCLASPPEVTISAAASVVFSPLDLQLGDEDVIGADVGPEVGIVVTGEVKTSGSSWDQFASLGVCFGLAWSAAVPDVNWSAQGVIPNPAVQLYGTRCPLGSSGSDRPNEIRLAQGKNAASGSVSGSGLLQLDKSPAAVPKTLKLATFYEASLGSAIVSDSQVAIMDLCGAASGSVLYWLDAKEWKEVSPPGSVPKKAHSCLDFQIGAGSKPSLSSLGGDVYFALGQPKSDAVISVKPKTVAPGGSLKAVLSGFNAAQSVTITWGSPDGKVLGIVTMNSKGAGSATFVAPTEVKAGSYVIYASGSDGPGATAKVTVT